MRTSSPTLPGTASDIRTAPRTTAARRKHHADRPGCVAREPGRGGARGHRIRALAPITPDSTARALPSAQSRGELRVTWFPVPYFAPFDDSVPDEDRRLEGARIQEWLHGCIAAERPDVLLVGRGAYG